LIKIINKRTFISENSLCLFFELIILDLAIIISAAIRILRINKVEDMVSIDEIGVIDKLE